jgi:L-ribulose-5-phosphate 3-epimerase
MGALAKQHGVRVDSMCADWFMDQPLLSDGDAGVEKLRWLVTRSAAAGIRKIVIPFVDASALRSEQDTEEAARLLARALPVLDDVPVELHLETSLPPGEFAALLDRLDHPLLRANYDTGNSASLGYDPRDEFAAYGARIGSVHVKDRVLDGGTVPLGEGAADIELVFALLRERGWERPLVLQTARGQAGLETEKVRADAEHVQRLWAESGSPAWT